MDILDLYSRLKNSYKEYISSFVRIIRSNTKSKSSVNIK